MASTLPLLRSCAQENSAVSRRERDTGTTDNSVVSAPDLQPLLHAAIEESGLAHKEVAAALEVPAAYLSAMLAGTKPLTVDRIEKLPCAVMTRWLLKVGEAYGLRLLAEDSTAKAFGDALDALSRLVRLGSFPKPKAVKVTR